MAFMAKSFFGYVVGVLIILLWILILPDTYIRIRKYFITYINRKIFLLFYTVFLIILYVLSSIVIPLNTSYGDDIVSLSEKYTEISK